MQSLHGHGKEVVPLGPWGGQGGLRWDDGTHSGVKQIEIVHGAGVDSIKIEYDKNGVSHWSEKHGGRGGSKTDKVRLDYPEEFLTSVHGYYGSSHTGGAVFVRSLTFQTNKRTLGPYGVQQGTHFSLQTTQGKIVGFHGKAGWFLDAIGVYLEPLQIITTSHAAITHHSQQKHAAIAHHTQQKNAAIAHQSHQNDAAIVRQSHQQVLNGTERYEYSMMQGNFGENYELLVAVKRKDGNFHPEIHSNHGNVHGNGNIHHETHSKHTTNYQNHKDGDIHFHPEIVKPTANLHPENHPKPTANHQNHKDGKNVHFHPEIHSKETANHQNHKDGNVHFHPEIHPKQTANSHEVQHTEHHKVTSIVPTKIEKVSPKKMPGVTSYGPWGGTGGSVFDDGVYDGIRQILVSRNVGIVSIRACYEMKGQPIWGAKNGGTGGFKTEKIVLDYPSEVLTQITGYHHPTMVMGPTIIRSLTFYTSKGKYGPYGEEKGQSFSTNLQHGSILGFHGRGGLFLDAIGVHVLDGKVFPTSNFPPKIVQQNHVVTKDVVDDTSLWSFKQGKRSPNDEGIQRIVKDPAPYGPGPWGGEGGKPWDDGVFTGIKQIILTFGDMGITCLEIEYDRSGQSVWSVKHGGNGGNITHRVKLDYPNEVLTCISGYYGAISKDQAPKVLKSLTFNTTRRKFGPYGDELGSYFTSNTTEGKVVGFHGRSGIYLDAIGVHMQHWLGYQKAKPSSLMKMFS